MKRTGPISFSTSVFDDTDISAATIHMAAGEQVFAEGDMADAWFRVDAGVVKLTTKIHGNRTAGMAIILPGECFGESGLVTNARCATTATSLQKCTIRRVSKKVLARRLREETPLARMFSAYLLSRITYAERDRADQLVNSSEKRLALLLLRLSERYNSRDANLHVDQATLADMVGTTRSRVSHFMNGFRKKRLLTYNGDLKVNHSKLAAFVGSVTRVPHSTKH